MASDTRNPARKDGSLREKVRILPGFHLADWMRASTSYKYSDNEVPPKLRRISVSELARHNKEDDCWMAYEGKVYNVTHYFPYHPGGIPKLMLCAGADCKPLYDKYHRWVNIDNLVGKCFVGHLDLTLGDSTTNEATTGSSSGGSSSSSSSNSSSKSNSSSNNGASGIESLVQEAENIFKSLSAISMNSSKSASAPSTSSSSTAITASATAATSVNNTEVDAETELQQKAIAALNADDI